MEKFGSIVEILRFAVEREQESVDFYTELAEKVDNDDMKQVFVEFAAEEKRHRQKLEQIQASGEVNGMNERVADLKIGDYLVEIDPEEDPLDYQNALIIAMKKEKKAFLLYSDLAEKAQDGAVAELFLQLAQEEAKHKLRFEVEYDERILTDN